MGVPGSTSHNGYQVVVDWITVSLSLTFFLFVGSYMEFLPVASRMLKRQGMALMNVVLNKGTFFTLRK